MKTGGIRKRIMVNEMQLFNLFREIKQVRDAENKERFFKEFKKMMKDAQFLSFTIDEKKEGGEDE